MLLRSAQGLVVWLAVIAAVYLPGRAFASGAGDMRGNQRHFADYDAEPRRADGRVDVEALASRLQQLGVTTYYWLIWHAVTDWDDLKSFLPLAARNGLTIWVYLVPPSESPPQYGTLYSEPFRLDYQRWAEEIGRLSLVHTNLAAWVIDDFYANHKFFTPDYIRQMRDRARRVNPGLQFLPLMYFNEISRPVVEAYREVVDGMIVAYPQNREEIERAWAILKDRPVAESGELSFPWETSSQPGDFISVSQTVRVLSGETHAFRFRERDDFTGATSGYHFKQMLLNGVVVWEEDAAGGTNGWREVVVKLPKLERGTTQAELSFRLLDKRGVSNFGLSWELGELIADGLQIPAALEERDKWTVTRRGAFEAGYGKTADQPHGRFKIPFIVMTAGQASEFKLRHGEPASPERIGEWLRMCLKAWRESKCDGVCTYCLEKEQASRTFDLARKAFAEYR